VILIENTDLVEKLLVGNFADGVSDRTVMDDRRLTAEATFNMAIQTVVACVHLSADEPETVTKLTDNCLACNKPTLITTRTYTRTPKCVEWDVKLYSLTFLYLQDIHEICIMHLHRESKKHPVCLSSVVDGPTLSHFNNFCNIPAIFQLER